MTYNLVMLPEAEAEAAEAFAWYQGKRLGLGDEFSLALEATLEFLRRSPLVFRETYKNGRKAKLRRFPYVVIYFVEEDTVVVVSVHHSSRNPTRWRGRLYSRT